MVAASALYGVTALRAEGDSIKEDVSSYITNISPTDTPFLTMLPTGKATSNLHEWQRDNNDAAVNNNAHVDGDDFGTSTPGDNTTAPQRLGNRCQISKKQLRLTGRALEGLDLHGRRTALGYQMAKKVPALKTDMEMSITANQIAVAEAGATPARSAGMAQWIATNDDFGAGGASGALNNATYGEPTTARIDGANRAASETTILSVILAARIAGGKINVISMRPEIKARLSAYFFQGGASSARIASPQQDFGPNPDPLKVSGTVGIWQSDFGVHMLIENLFQRTEDILCVDTKRWKVCYLRKHRVKKMGATGDSDRRHVLVDWTLESCDERASALVTDISDVAMVN